MVDTGKLLRLINSPYTSYQERQIARRVYDQVYVLKNVKQLELSCTSYLSYVDEFKSHNSILGAINIFNQDLYEIIEEIYHSRHSICRNRLC